MTQKNSPANTAHFLTSLEDCVELDLPQPIIDMTSLNWVRYNPRKNIDRWGASITSLDGNNSGIPDLDSLREYNALNNTRYSESDFKILSKQAIGFQFMTELFDVGRSHFIRLGPGGYFPYHRDLDITHLRILYTIKNCQPENLAWIQNDKILKFQNQCWYYINTIQAHALFSFGCVEFAVFNIGRTDKSMSTLLKSTRIR